MTQIRKLEPGEHIQTRALWEQIFEEDSKAFLDYYYFMKAKENEIYVVEEDNEIRSMIHLNPYTLKTEDTQFRGNYIVGVATEAAYRKRGYMGCLLRQTLQDMYHRKELFTFLMPAAEAIYTPYDFRYIYKQTQLTLTQINTHHQFTCREASFFDCEQLASFFTDHMESHWQICAIRDTAYYQSLLLERQSEQGGIRMIFDKDKLIGTFTYMSEDGLEILEPLFLPGYEDAFEDSVSQLMEEKHSSFPVKVYASYQENMDQKPVIMARILHLEALLKTLKIIPGEHLHCSFAVLDYILPQNSKIWEIYSINTDEPDNSRSLHVKESEDSEGVLTIGALTSLLFGFKTVEEIALEENVILTEHLSEELKKIQPFTRVYLNEVV